MRILYCEYCKAFYVGYRLVRCGQKLPTGENHIGVLYSLHKLPKDEEMELYAMFCGEGILPTEDMKASDVARMSYLLSKTEGGLAV